MTPYEHRQKHNLDIPKQCEGFIIDDFVEYEKDGESRRGYIYCFRPFGYSWFAWIYFDKNTLYPEESIFVRELKRLIYRFNIILLSMKHLSRYC